MTDIQRIKNIENKTSKRWSAITVVVLVTLILASLLALQLIKTKSLTTTKDATKRLMVIGNSLDAIDQANSGRFFSSSGTWITKTLPILGSEWVAPEELNVAASGVTTTHFLNKQLPIILAAHRSSTYATDVCFVGSPVNDFIIDGSTAQASYERMRTIIRKLRIAGIQVVTAGCTSCYREYGVQPIANIQASIVEYNNLITATGAKADMGYNALIPWPQDKRIDEFTEINNIRDGLHFYDDGNDIKAKDAAPIIASITNEVYTLPITAQPTAHFRNGTR